MTSIHNTQEVKSSSKESMTITEESLDLDNRIGYKKRREELNRRVRSILEQKKPLVNTRN